MKRRFETCSLCGRDWNVSLNLKLDKPYLCPGCTEKLRRADRKYREGKKDGNYELHSDSRRS